MKGHFATYYVSDELINKLADMQLVKKKKWAESRFGSPPQSCSRERPHGESGLVADQERARSWGQSFRVRKLKSRFRRSVYLPSFHSQQGLNPTLLHLWVFFLKIVGETEGNNRKPGLV